MAVTVSVGGIGVSVEVLGKVAVGGDTRRSKVTLPFNTTSSGVVMAIVGILLPVIFCPIWLITRPRTITPFANVENLVPQANVTVRSNKHSRKTSSAPISALCGRTLAIKYPIAETPPNIALT